MLVKDITRLNSSFEYSNDVQLDSFNGQTNHELVTNYIFTAGNVPGKSSSVTLLEKFQDALLNKSENRFMVLATYGQGKSHFGLTLANYFGKPAESDELGIIFDKIGAAVRDDARVGAFRDFKRHHKPYLVLLLRGDEPGNLREKFYKALDAALQRDSRTQDLRPPFWFAKAQEFVDNIQKDAQDAAKAEEFLARERLDLATLKEGLANKRSDLYGVCRNLAKEIYGFLPDFGGETSLSDAIAWITEELCDARDLFAGAVILFDEFGAFIAEYSAKHNTGVPLQEMLHGVENKKGQVLAIAFTHFDPENIVRQEGESSSSAELLKELERFPKSNRFRLHSPIEEVLRTYFNTDHDNWQTFMGSASIDVADASDVAYMVFQERYQQGLAWSSEVFQEKITRDCFPVHPLTIALIANINFQGANTTRSILGFLTDDNRGYLKPKLEQDALIDGKPNWVLPTDLVDYFGEMLGGQVWNQYKSVKVPDLKPIQQAALKGMVLQAAAELPSYNVNGYANLIATLCGHDEEEIAETLRNLEEQRYIRYDSANRTYSFWAGGNGAVALDRLLNEEITYLKQEERYASYLDHFRAGTTKVNELLEGKREPLNHSYPVSVNWGHPEDWAAKEFVVTIMGFNLDTLKSLALHYTVPNLRDLKNTPKYRAIALLLIASSQDELQRFRDHAETMFDRDQSLHAAPLMLLLPETPNPTLATHLVKYSILQEEVFAQRAKYKVGEQVFDEEFERLQNQLKQELANARKEADIIVPKDARGRVRALSISKRSQRRIEQTLKEVLEITYPRGPRDFYTQYKHASGNSMRSAIGNLVPVLLENNLANAAGLSRLAEDTVTKYVDTAWGMLTPQWQLKEPASSHIRHGWELLDGTFEEGRSVSVAPVLKKLLQIPYGYDPNTLTLLFSAWYGYHRLKLEISKDGQLLAPDSSEFSGKDKPDQFLHNLEHVYIQRRDQSKPAADVEEILAAVEKGGLSEDTAKKYLGKLRTYTKHHEGEDVNLDSLVETATSKLSEGVYRVGTYKEQVPKLQQQLQTARQLEALIPLFEKLDKLPNFETVKSDLPDKYSIRQSLEAKAEELVKQQCSKLSQLRQLTNYGKHQDDLKDMRKHVSQMGLGTLEGCISEALERLDAEKVRLESEGKEQPTLERIKAYNPTVSLSYLKQYRQELEEYLKLPSERIQQAAQQKHAAIQAEIYKLEDFTGELYKRIDNLTSSQAASNLIDQINMKLHRFDGRDADYVNDDLQRCQQLEEFFQELMQVATPKTPTQADAVKHKLDEIAQKFASVLSKQQVSLIDEQRVKIDTKIAQEVERAANWLEQQARKLHNTLDSDWDTLLEIQKGVETPPPFLDHSGQAKLQELQQTLSAKLDANTLESIVHRFEQIKDVDTQRQCLRRLRAILDNQQAPQDESDNRDAAHLS